MILTDEKDNCYILPVYLIMVLLVVNVLGVVLGERKFGICSRHTRCEWMSLVDGGILIIGERVEVRTVVENRKDRQIDAKRAPSL